MSFDEGCAGQAGAEPQTWETSRGRGWGGVRRLGYAQGQDRAGRGRARAFGRGPLPGRDREPARGRAAADRAVGRAARPAQGLPRGRPVRLRPLSAAHRARPRLHGGGALAGPAPARRPGEDEPARRPRPGAPAAGRGAYARDDVAPLRVELSTLIPRPRLRDRPRDGTPPSVLKRLRPPEGS